MHISNRCVPWKIPNGAENPVLHYVYISVIKVLLIECEEHAVASCLRHYTISRK
jgi:hypothetical protein